VSGAAGASWGRPFIKKLIFMALLRRALERHYRIPFLREGRAGCTHRIHFALFCMRCQLRGRLLVIVSLLFQISIATNRYYIAPKPSKQSIDEWARRRQEARLIRQLNKDARALDEFSHRKFPKGHTIFELLLNPTPNPTPIHLSTKIMPPTLPTSDTPPTSLPTSWPTCGHNSDTDLCRSELQLRT
jgi:hypothetical protein